MADTIKIEDIEERVVLVGVSEQDGDDADDSLSELAELVKTAGATVVGTLIQRREKIHPGTYVGTGKVAEIAELVESTGQQALCAMMSLVRHSRRIWRRTLTQRLWTGHLLFLIFLHQEPQQVRVRYRLSLLSSSTD